MGKSVEQPRKCIISARFSQAERDALLDAAQKTGMSLSELMREAVFFLLPPEGNTVQ